MVRVITLDEPFLPVHNDLGEGQYNVVHDMSVVRG